MFHYRDPAIIKVYLVSLAYAVHFFCNKKKNSRMQTVAYGSNNL